MIQEKYKSLFPYVFFSTFHRQCLKEIMNSGKCEIITTPLAIGEQFIPEFAIIRLLQTGLKHLVIYIFKGTKSMTSEYFYARYSSKSINVQKITKFSDIELNEDLIDQTNIFIMNFNDLVQSLQSASDEFINQISLIAFENITAHVSPSLEFEIFAYYTRKYKYRVVAINYSYEIRDKLCQIFNISNESKEILTYNGPKNNIIKFVSNQDIKNSSIDDIFLEEVKKYISEQKIVIFCNSKTNIKNTVKLIETSFPSLNDSENFFHPEIDPRYWPYISKGIGILDSTDINQNKKIWELFSNNSIKILIALSTYYLQVIQNDDTEGTNYLNHKINVAFIRSFSLKESDFSYLTPYFSNDIIVINNKTNIEKISKCILGNPTIKLSDENYLIKLILLIIKKFKIKSIKEIENIYNKCFNNSFPIQTAFNYLITNNLVQFSNEHRDSFEITELGNIAENFCIIYSDLQIFISCKKLKSFGELLAFLCTQTATASRSVEFKEEDNKNLQLMLEDSKIPYERSYIHYNLLNSINNNDKKDSFTIGEKAYIILLYSIFNTDNPIDSDFASEAESVFRNVTILCSCFRAVSDLHRSFSNMCISRELEKRLKLRYLNNDPLKLLTQISGIGEVYGKKLLDSGIKNYQDILGLNINKIKDILKRAAIKLAKSIKELPNYCCEYKTNENSEGVNLIFTVSNKCESTESKKNHEERKISLICGTVNDDKVLYFEELKEISDPVEINVCVNEGVELDQIEFRVIDSEFVGPDIIMKCRTTSMNANLS